MKVGIVSVLFTDLLSDTELGCSGGADGWSWGVLGVQMDGVGGSRGYLGTHRGRMS